MKLPVTPPGGASTTWSYTTPVLPPGSYLIRISGYDSVGKWDATYNDIYLTVTA
jgi:hypothetical protein